MVDVRDSAIQGVRIGVNRYINSVSNTLYLDTPGTYTVNAARVIGGVRVLEGHGVITRLDAINGVTNLWSDLWDGTKSTPVTKTPGADLSDAQVGTLFFRSGNALSPMEVMISDEGRFYECTTPLCTQQNAYTLNAKNGVETFLRFHLTIGGLLDGETIVSFTWEAYPQGRLELLTFP